MNLVALMIDAQSGRDRDERLIQVWKFVVKYDQGGNAYWRLDSGNGQMVAWSGESFASWANAVRAANAFKAGASTATYDVYSDSGGSWRWRAIRGGNYVASSGESFYSKPNADRAAENVRLNAGGASGP